MSVSWSISAWAYWPRRPGASDSGNSRGMSAFRAFPLSATSRARTREGLKWGGRPLHRMRPPPGIYWQSPGVRHHAGDGRRGTSPFAPKPCSSSIPRPNRSSTARSSTTCCPKNTGRPMACRKMCECGRRNSRWGIQSLERNIECEKTVVFVSKWHTRSLSAMAQG